MANTSIINVNVSQELVPIPNNFLQRVIMVSAGGTTMPVLGVEFIASMADAALIGVTDSEFLAKSATFFANAQNAGFYVVELGVITPPDTTATLVAFLSTFIAQNSGQYFVYDLPAEAEAWVGISTLLAAQAGLSNSLYFTMGFKTTASFASVADGNKSVIGCIFSSLFSPPSSYPDIIPFAIIASTKLTPGQNQLQPLGNRYAINVDVYPDFNRYSDFKNVNLNYITTGAEGGISNKLIQFGVTADGKQWSYYYGLAWWIINIKQALAATVITRANLSQSPLYYNQDGINALLAVLQQLAQNAVALGIALPPPTGANSMVSAIDFLTYVTANPADYAAGIYNGLSVRYIAQQVFIEIGIDLTVSLAAASA